MSVIEDVSKSLDLVKKQKKLNAILYLNKDARDDAKKVDKKIKSGKAGKLAGHIIAVKSAISVKGLPVTCASKTLESYRGTYDADVIQKIRAEDAVIIGMANMDEFASGASGETSAFGPTQNPVVDDLIPGGSSSGSAASVGAGLSTLALGTDTGGSIRNPASHCGVVGIKPSYGSVSRYGLLDLAMSFDQIGPLAKNVNDAALLLDVISGKSINDPIMKDVPSRNLTKSSKTTVKNLKIGVIEEFFDMCAESKIADSIMNATEDFAKDTGSKVTKLKLKHINLAIQTYYPIVYVEFFSATRKYDGRRYGKKIEDSCGIEVLRRILGGREISRAEYHGTYYRRALKAKQIIAKELDSAFSKVDAIFLPTTPKLPHKIGAKLDPLTMYAYDAFTIPANLGGICAGVVPTNKIRGIPVGLQIFCSSLHEASLVSIMSAAEKLSA